MKHTNIVLNMILGCSLIWTTLAFADDDAPVIAGTSSSASADQSADVMQSQSPEDASSIPASSASAIDTSNMSLEERVALLERQMAAANRLNLLNQVNNLQQQLQELQGQVEELSHTVQTLSTQSASQYTDIDQRLRKLEGSGQPKDAQASVSSSTNGQSSSLQDQGDEQAAYQAAYDKVKNGNYTDGIESMRKFLTQYPNSTYVPNAHYWLGQMYLLKGDGKNAAQEFDIVIHQYPQHSKVKDATLKLGFAYLLQNKTAAAKSQFKKVMQLYPGTSTAQLAEARLAQMPQ